ncbi:MAG: cytochrome c [Deltaproteobacteria bacterium]|nr:cytochrome c [Deltaproteobacteria bacterium]
MSASSIVLAALRNIRAGLATPSVIALFIAGCASAKSDAPVRPAMPVPANLSSEARAALGARMQGHGDDMNDLLWSILFLDFASTHDIAAHISSQTLVPSGVVPAEIVAFEGRLHALAGELERASKAEDSAKVAELYGKVAETCVRCHASYLLEPPTPIDQVQAGEPPS